MSTSILSGYIKDIAGTTVPDCPVVVRLRPGNGFRISDHALLASRYETTTDGTGFFTATLEENANIFPDNSYYEVIAMIPRERGGTTITPVEVGASDADLYESMIMPEEAGLANALTLEAADARYARLGYNPTSDLVYDPADFGAQYNGVDSDWTGLQGAITAASVSGRPAWVLLRTGTGPSQALIDHKLVINSPYVRFASVVGHGSTGAGFRIQAMAGFADTSMLELGTNTKGVQLRGFTLDCASRVATGLNEKHSEDHLIEDIVISGNTGKAWNLGDGVANNNGLFGRNIHINYGNLAGGILGNAVATENVELHQVTVTPLSGGVAGDYLVDMQNGNYDWYGMVLDDNAYTGYAMRMQGGATARWYNLVSEMKQTLQTLGATRSRGSAIYGGDLRSCDPQSGSYPLELNIGGSNDFQYIPFILEGLRVNRAAGATQPCDVYVNNGHVVATGVFFIDSEAISGSGTTVARGATAAVSSVTGLYTGRSGQKIRIQGAGHASGVYESTLAAVADGEHATLTDVAGTATTNALTRIGKWGKFAPTSTGRVFDFTPTGVTQAALAFVADDKYGVKARINGKNVNVAGVTGAFALKLGEAEYSGLTDGYLEIDAGVWHVLVNTVEIAKVDNPANDGETALLVRVDKAGTFSLRRVMMGASGTGPGGGTQRALYVDAG